MTQSPETYYYGSSADQCPPTPCYDYDGSYYNPSSYGSGILYKRKRRSFAAEAKPIGKLDRNGNSASYGYSFSIYDQCYSDYSPFAIYPNSSSYDYDCPDFTASYSSFSDNSYMGAYFDIYIFSDTKFGRKWLIFTANFIFFSFLNSDKTCWYQNTHPWTVIRTAKLQEHRR
jgi:hypothetical protein